MNWQEDQEYNLYVADLLVRPEVLRLQNYVQHHHSDRLTHSISVSYQSYRWAKKLNLDAKAVARAGLLHDMFYYDWRETKFELGTHAYIHPRVSLRNAEKLTPLSPMEKDIILKHMFGATLELPQYRESFLVDMVDNVAAVQEYFAPKWQAVKARFNS
ncbi:HD domain-containing protein [Periweissella fabaria]|nr:HD domain-containing protein [Periweissella fabaria]MCM0596722.1 HD domain-containing protein [Periweissella fabaria]